MIWHTSLSVSVFFLKSYNSWTFIFCPLLHLFYIFILIPNDSFLFGQILCLLFFFCSHRISNGFIISLNSSFCYLNFSCGSKSCLFYLLFLFCFFFLSLSFLLFTCSWGLRFVLIPLCLVTSFSNICFNSPFSCYVQFSISPLSFLIKPIIDFSCWLP